MLHVSSFKCDLSFVKRIYDMYFRFRRSCFEHVFFDFPFFLIILILNKRLLYALCVTTIVISTSCFVKIRNIVSQELFVSFASTINIDLIETLDILPNLLCEVFVLSALSTLIRSETLI